MMRIQFLLLLLIPVLVGCRIHKCDLLDEELPTCIQNIINSPLGSSKLLTIQTQFVKGTQHYWLNTGDNAFDGLEYIVGKNCDTLCAYGSRLPDPCSQLYLSDHWKIIWKK